MKTVKLSDLFNIDKPTTLIYSNCTPDKNGINYVSSKGENNGIVGKIQTIPNRKIYDAGCITVPLKGTVLAAHLQTEKCYVAHQIAVLTPKKEMTNKEKLYYCMCIRANKFRYSYGRQADGTLSDLQVPSEIPEWVYKIEEPDLSKYKESYNNNSTLELNTSNWQEFKFEDIFNLKQGNADSISNLEEGNIPYVSASGNNNGVIGYVNTNKNIFKGNAITIPSVGNSVAIAGYQANDFVLSGNAIALYSDYSDFNQYHAMFFITLIKLEKFRYCYGRVWSMERMKKSTIKLPTTEDGEPDYKFMEDYIKTLPYSKYI